MQTLETLHAGDVTGTHRDALLRNTFPVWCYLANRESASQCARRTDWNLPDSEFH